jgi:hypothetical protein
MSDENVIHFPTQRNLSPNKLVESSVKDPELNHVMIVGTDENDFLVVRSTPMPESLAVYLLERAKIEILTGGTDDDVD